MIDVKSEKLLRLEAVSRIKWLPKQSTKRLAFSTVYRWATRGVRGGIKLETVRIGSALHTSEEAVERFIYRSSGEPAAAISQGAADANTEERLRQMGAM
jgi:hypothetical protein